MPQALDDCRAEGEVDDHQDRAAIDRHQDFLLGTDPVADPGLQDLADDEGREQLQQDLLQCIPGEAAMAADGKEQADEQRGQEHAEDVGSRCRADGRRHIAAGHRGKGDRRLHRRRQDAEEENAEVKRLRQDRIGNEAERQAEQREHGEGRQKNDEMQPPVQEAGNDDIAREARAMQEEQQRDGEIGGDAEVIREVPLAGSSEARMTVQTSRIVKVSGRKRRMTVLSAYQKSVALSSL